jgi:hypothetical protein
MLEATQRSSRIRIEVLTSPVDSAYAMLPFTALYLMKNY